MAADAAANARADALALRGGDKHLCDFPLHTHDCLFAVARRRARSSSGSGADVKTRRDGNKGQAAQHAKGDLVKEAADDALADPC